MGGHREIAASRIGAGILQMVCFFLSLSFALKEGKGRNHAPVLLRPGELCSDFFGECGREHML